VTICGAISWQVRETFWHIHIEIQTRTMAMGLSLEFVFVRLQPAGQRPWYEQPKGESIGIPWNTIRQQMIQEDHQEKYPRKQEIGKIWQDDKRI